MTVRLKNIKDNPVFAMRRCGYGFLRSDGQEWSFVRRITGSDYPRFHVYAKMEGSDLLVNLHLDQKKPSYEGSHAHSGEYDGELVEREAERIKSFYPNAN